MEFFINYIFLPLIILGIIVFIHELGHFGVARYFGIRTPVFSVGFGREILGYTDKNGTRWKLSIFPLGGYVSIDGSDDDPLYKRAWIAAAGPIANFLFAIIGMFLLAIFLGEPRSPTIVAALSINGGAYEAGLMPGDKVLYLNNNKIDYFSEEISDFVDSARDNRIKATIERKGQILDFFIHIRETQETDDFGVSRNPKRMGIIFAGYNFKLSAVNAVNGINTEGNLALAREELIRNFGKTITINFGKGTEREDLFIYVDRELNGDLLRVDSPKYSSFILWDSKNIEYWPQSVKDSFTSAFELTYDVCKKTLGVLYQIIVGKKDTGDLGGVVAISSMTADVAEQSKVTGFYHLVRFMFILSINIGFLNLLPLPLLDGGNLMFYGIEGLRGRPISRKAKAYIYAAGIMFIIILSVTVNVRDIYEKIAV